MAMTTIATKPIITKTTTTSPTHKKKRKDEKEEKHPWAGLCVVPGSFCGNNLFGYDFIPDAVYSCERTAG